MRVEIGTLAPEEVDAAIEVLAASYGRSSAEGARHRVTLYREEWLAVRCDGAVAGVVTANRYGTVAYVAMMAVSPQFRKNGLGTRLMTELVGRLDREGHRTLLLDARKEAEGIYGRLGFREIDRTAFFERPPCAPYPTGDGKPIDAVAFARVCELDRRFYGCDRGLALRRFAAEPHALAMAAPDAYVMARGPVVGPFAAERPEEAAALLAAALAQNVFALRAFLPRANRDAAALFESHGFREQRTLAHMERGEPSPFRRDRIYSQGSLGHG